MFIEERTVDLNKYRSRAGQVKPIILRRGEKGQTQLKITVNDYDKTYSFSGMTAKFCAYTSAGEWVQTSATLSGNVATYTVGSDLTSSAGEVKVAYIEFSNSTDVLTSDNIPIIVLDNIDLTKDQANKYTPLIDDLIAKMNKALSDADTATKAANTAASSATTAANNANTARTNATNAATSANSAATSANNAAKSANDAAAKVTDAMATFKTIQSIKVEFATADQGTTAPSAGWSTTSPTAVKGKWIWTRTTITYNTGSPEIKYEAVYSGLDGSFAGEDRMTKLEQTVDSINDITTGINLLRGTRDFRQGTQLVQPGLNTSLFYDGVNAASTTYIHAESTEPNGYATVTKRGGSDASFIPFTPIPDEYAHSELTASFDILLTEQPTKNINIARFCTRPKNINTDTNNNFITVADTGYTYETIPLNEWVQVVYHLDTPYTVDLDENYVLFEFYNNSNVENSVAYRKPKVEPGHINHPCWSPSPFDIDTINDYTTGVNLLRGTRDFAIGKTITGIPGQGQYPFLDGFYIRERTNIVNVNNDYSYIENTESGSRSRVQYSAYKTDNIDDYITIGLEVRAKDTYNLNLSVFSIYGISVATGSGTIVVIPAGIKFADFKNAENIETDKWVKIWYQVHITDITNLRKAEYLTGYIDFYGFDIRKIFIYTGNINHPVYFQSPLDVAENYQIENMLEIHSVVPFNTIDDDTVETWMTLKSGNYGATSGTLHGIPSNRLMFIHHDITTPSGSIAQIAIYRSNMNAGSPFVYFRSIKLPASGVMPDFMPLASLSDITANNLQGVIPIEKGGNGNKFGSVPMINLVQGDDLFKLYTKTDSVGLTVYLSYNVSVTQSLLNKPDDNFTTPLVILCNTIYVKTQAELMCISYGAQGETRLFTATIGQNANNKWTEFASKSTLNALTAQIATLQTALLSSGAITQKQLLAAEKEVQATLNTSTMELPSGEVQVEAELPSVESSTMELPVGEVEVTTTPEVSTEDVMEAVTMEEPITDETETKTVRRRKKSTE